MPDATDAGHDRANNAGGGSPETALTETPKTTMGDPQDNPNPPHAIDGFRRTDPSERVTYDEAISALSGALELLKAASNPNEPWQDARNVLDVTGDALDVAGLALKAADGDGDDDGDGGGGDEESDRKLGEVQWLSMMVSAARSKLLGKAYLDAKRKGPPPLPAAGTEGGPLIVWASQTGTAESFANALAKTLGKAGGARGGKIDVMDMKDAALADVVRRRRVYFVVSTFGLGRPPRKAEAFYASLQLYQGGEVQGGKGGAGVKEVGGGAGGGDFRPLAGLEVAVAALGDSRFNNFAAFGINLANELQALGARPVIKVTTVDGKEGQDEQREEFEAWEDLVKKLERARIGGGATSADGVSRTRQGGDGDAAAASSCCVVS